MPLTKSFFLFSSIFTLTCLILFSSKCCKNIKKFILFSYRGIKTSLFPLTSVLMACRSVVLPNRP